MPGNYPKENMLLRFKINSLTFIEKEIVLLSKTPTTAHVKIYGATGKMPP